MTTQIPACYYPNGVRQPVKTIPAAKVAGWYLGTRGLGRDYADPPRRAAPEPAESACDLIAFYRDYPFASCSFRTALVLARLHAEYGRRG